MSDAFSEYQAAASSLEGLVARSRLTLLGFSVAVDAIHALDAGHIAAIHDAASGASGRTRELFAAVWPLLSAGRDGEVWCDWPDASPQLTGLFPTSLRVGGNAGQAANVLSALGVQSLLALTDRRPAQLATLGANVRIAEPDGRLVPPADVTPTSGPGRPLHHVLEFRSGTPLPGGSGAIPRSGRVILRLSHDGPAYDEHFAAAARVLSGGAGTGLVTGLNKVPPADVDHAYAWCVQRAREWRRAGVRFVHHELSTYPHQARTVAALTPVVNSLGLSQSELVSFAGLPADPAEAAGEVLERYGLDRVSVHGDRWALTVSRADPELERQALLVGCLVAAARAESGAPAMPNGIPPAAQLLDTARLPPPLRRRGLAGVCVPTLWLARPAATVGLGDSFVAGTLLTLGAKLA
ncbi:MAG TPA: ADP-dependent glucokinase/phosphofructokinase [Mycobacteriales bacterium]|nr:ADP-dependent glucokinase/phosphofructokinase [Mycobacteriales bacterium]